DATQEALRQAFGRRVNRRDATKVNRALGIVFDHFKFGMIHANALAAHPRLSENDELLAGRDHFLDVMQIEPATDERLAQRVRVRLLQCCLENFSPPAKSPQRCLNHVAGETDWRVALLARKTWKLMSLFVPSREMREQIFDGENPESPQRQNFGPRYPIEFFQRTGNFHQVTGTDLRNASTRISKRVSPWYSSDRIRNA